MKSGNDSFARFVEVLKLIGLGIGVWIAYNEFVIKDVAREKLISENSIDLILEDLSGPMLDARDVLSQAVSQHIRGEEGPDLEGAKALLRAASPFRSYVHAWESCISAQLCDEGIGVRYLCTRAKAYADIQSYIELTLPDNSNKSNALFDAFLVRCD